MTDSTTLLSSSRAVSILTSHARQLVERDGVPHRCGSDIGLLAKGVSDAEPRVTKINIGLRAFGMDRLAALVLATPGCLLAIASMGTLVLTAFDQHPLWPPQ